jgi:CubicO group peptidase (beta-lactamase class C family)
MGRKKGMRFLIAGLSGLLLFSGCAGPFQTLTPDMIRSDLEGVRARYFVPSLGVAEITMDKIITYGPVGKARINSDTLVTSDSLYQLGSCTKAMTATVLLKLMQEHSLSWNTRLLDIFPEHAATAHRDYDEVTLGDIVSHQAGFPVAGDNATINRLRNYNGSLTRYLGEILQRPSRIKRGRYLYSNNGYAALGAVIERLSGLPYTEAMTKLLFDPLDVKPHFGFPSDLGPDQPWGHTANWGAAAPGRAMDQFIPTILWPAGMASMTLRDYARFVQLHLRGMLGRDDAGFSSDMVGQLHQARIRIDSSLGGDYAAGWVIEKVYGRELHWHNGSAGNFMVYMAINPTRKKGVVVVTNVGDVQGDRVCWDIVERMLIGRGRSKPQQVLSGTVP